MKKIAIVTDSNSGITQMDAKKLGIYVIPMPFFINGIEYLEDITLTQEAFYEKLKKGADIGTSQPTIGSILDLWDELLKEYDEIVHIPMSSGLSGSYQTASGLALDYTDTVFVVNNQRISVTQRQSAIDAKNLALAGKSGQEIKKILEQSKFDSTIYITVDDLNYLKKGGRITATAAALGLVLNIKPILTIQGEKLDAYSKCRGMKQAKKNMIEALRNDLEVRFPNCYAEKKIHLQIAHTNNAELAESFKIEIQKEFPGFEIHIDPLSLSISCHIGPGALAFACCTYVESETETE
ncbi:MAG: DegV family protein [Velocimicrobium sp.]